MGVRTSGWLYGVSPSEDL